MRTALLLGTISVAVGVASSVRAQPASTAAAADDRSYLEEVVVTAQRRAENLQDVPLAVTALTAESLASKNIVSAAELTFVTPGLTYTTQVGTAVPRIRGVGATTAIGGAENPVSTYVDGVYFASAASSVLAFNNIEQIAVLKGPQGTLFGRNATGGLIQITTRDPEHRFGGLGSVTYGNHETIGADVYLTGGISQALAGDLAVYYLDQRDGFGTNLATGRDTNKSRDFAFRSKWKLEIGDATTARLALDYASARAAAPPFRPVSGSVPITGVPFTGGKFDINANEDYRYANEQRGVSLNVTHELNDVRLVSVTAYRGSQSKVTIDIDRTPAAIVVSKVTLPDRQFTQEFQVLSDDQGAFQWVLGAYYFWSSGGYDPGIVISPAATTTFVTRQETESLAAFGQGTVDVSDRTRLTLGLRYTGETRDYRGLGNILSTAGRATPPGVAGRLEVEKLTWRVALDHRFSERVLGYISHNRGFKSGGFNPTVFQGQLSSFRPEVLDALEVGLKADLLDGRLRINTAAYYYDYKDIQLTAFNFGLLSYYNAAASKIYGLDMDVTAAPTERLTLTAGLSLIHARFGDFPGATISSPRPGGGNLIVAGDATGNRLPTTPDWTLNLGFEYTAPLPSGEVRLAANYFHSDGWRAEPDNRIGQKAYDVLNASATWVLGDDDAYSVKLWGRNLTNEAYALQMSAQATADNVQFGFGRSFGVTVGVNF